MKLVTQQVINRFWILLKYGLQYSCIMMQICGIFIFQGVGTLARKMAKEPKKTIRAANEFKKSYTKMRQANEDLARPLESLMLKLQQLLVQWGSSTREFASIRTPMVTGILEIPGQSRRPPPPWTRTGWGEKMLKSVDRSQTRCHSNFNHSFGHKLW